MCQLPVHTDGELHDPRIAGKRGNGRGTSTAHVSARLAKQGVVGNVESLPPRLRIPVLVDRYVFNERSVEHLRVWTVERIPASVAHHVVAGVGERVGQAGAER